MIPIADNIDEALQNLAAAKAAYQTALEAARVKSDEGGSMIDIERQDLTQLEKALQRARAEVTHYESVNSGYNPSAPMYFGGYLR